MRKQNALRPGFTLIELSIVIVVMVLLGAVGYAQVTGLYAQGATQQLGAVSASLGSMLTAAADRLDKSACSLSTTEQTTLINVLDLPENVTVTPQGNTRYLIQNTRNGQSLVYTHQGCL